MKTSSNHCLPQAGERVLVLEDVAIAVRVAVSVTTKIAECTQYPSCGARFLRDRRVLASLVCVVIPFVSPHLF